MAIITSAILIILNIFDVVCTLYMRLSKGLEEMNPIVDFFLQNFGWAGLVLLKVLAVAPFVYLMIKYWKTFRIIRVSSYFVTLVYFLLAIYHIIGMYMISNI